MSQHKDTRANGYYIRDLYTPIGVIEDPRVARTGMIYMHGESA